MPFYAQVDSDGNVIGVMRSSKAMPVSESVICIDSYDPLMVGGKIVDGKITPRSPVEELPEASE